MKNLMIVKCPTASMMFSLLTYARKNKCWDVKGEKAGVFRWDDYRERTAVLMKDGIPNGYAPFDYYVNHPEFANARHVNCPQTYFMLMADNKEESTMNRYNHDEGDRAMAYLNAVTLVPDKDTPAEPQTVEKKPTGSVNIYKYALIENSKGITEVDEDIFAATPTMQQSKNVKHYVRTTITIADSLVSSATCEASMYDERQGILEAMANLVCQQFCDVTFEQFYRGLCKEKAAYELRIRKCPKCGVIYDTPKEAEECMKQHEENAKARKERRYWRKLAKNELKREAYRKRLDAEKAKILQEEAEKDTLAALDAEEARVLAETEAPTESEPVIETE